MDQWARADTTTRQTTLSSSDCRKAIAAIDQDAWTPIEYTDAVFDETTGRWVSCAEVAEVPFTAQKKVDHVPGRLVVRRIPDFNEKNKAAGQDALFDVGPFRAFFTTADAKVLDTVAADRPCGWVLVGTVDAPG